jgi:hypothetical protein
MASCLYRMSFGCFFTNRDGTEASAGLLRPLHLDSVKSFSILYIQKKIFW